MKHTTKDLRVFGIAMAVVLSAIGVWQAIASRPTAAFTLFAVAAAFLAPALVAPRILLPLFVPWRLFGFAMGFVMTRVILTIFFIVVITPTSLIRRLLGKDSLDRSLDADTPTWWRERKGGPPPRERYERQF